MFNSSFTTRFWRKVLKTNSCWLWTASTSNGRYGNISYNSSGDMIKAHRASYILAYGPIPNGLHVCHTCDTPLCVNPSHLFLGTSKDNHKDRNSKGRQAKGTTHGRNKLTELQVKEIRAKYIPRSYSTTKIAQEFGVSQSTIFNILKNKIWKHI
jgi:hypothetical protein